MSYKLVWNKETIEDNIPTKEEALYLKREYSLAYDGFVSLVRE